MAGHHRPPLLVAGVRYLPPRHEAIGIHDAHPCQEARYPGRLRASYQRRPHRIPEPPDRPVQYGEELRPVPATKSQSTGGILATADCVPIVQDAAEYVPAEEEPPLTGVAHVS